MREITQFARSPVLVSGLERLEERRVWFGAKGL